MNPPLNLPYSLILASQSPRRRELLTLLDLPFTLRPTPEFDESISPSIAPHLRPELIAKHKADQTPLSEGELLITADTVVIIGDRVLGKPHSIQEAYTMLSQLQGNSHVVVTGVCLTTTQCRRSFSCSTTVRFAPLTPQEIHYYLSHYAPLDKAGAYGVQEWIGAAAIQELNGSFYNVMGLPVHQLYQELKHFALPQ